MIEADEHPTASGAEPFESEPSDGGLIARVRNGDLEAFETLYRRHASGVYGLALRMLRNEADAEDLVQEIFLLAYDRLSSFEGRSAFGTWLYRLGVNRCLDFVRSRGARERSRTGPLEERRRLQQKARGR